MESYPTNKNTNKHKEITKSLIVEHLKKWYEEKRKAADGRWFVISVDGDPKLDPALTKQLKNDAKSFGVVIKKILPTIKSNLAKGSMFDTSDPKSIDKFIEKLNNEFETLFKRLDAELATDTENLWLINSNQDKKTPENSDYFGPEAARLDIFKSYIFALQNKIIDYVYGDQINFSKASKAEKKIIIDLYDQAEKYYKSYSDMNPLMRRRMDL